MQIIRGTTPTFEINLNFDANLIEAMYVTFLQGGKVVFEKDITSCEVKGDYVEVKLTQEETLLLNCGCTVAVQVRARLNDGTSLADEINHIKVKSVIKDGVI